MDQKSVPPKNLWIKNQSHQKNCGSLNRLSKLNHATDLSNCKIVSSKIIGYKKHTPHERTDY